MKFFEFAHLKPCTLQLSVNVLGIHKAIRVVTTEKNNPSAIYDDQTINVYNNAMIEIKLPFVPEIAVVQVFNVNDANDKYFEANVKVGALKIYPNIYAATNKHLKSYIKFLEEFAPAKNYLASMASNNEATVNATTYSSDCGKFVVNYFDRIYMDGMATNISMRVDKSKGAGDMDWCKQLIAEYNIPEFVVIALHEFSHVNINENPMDELEADFNSALIYCGLGFDKHYLITAWEKVYARTPTEQNKNRLNSIYWFVKDFNTEILKRFSK